MKFGTYSLPCFNEFYDLFYPEGTKLIPSNIAELLTDISLAYWLCDDGTFDKSNRTVILTGARRLPPFSSHGMKMGVCTDSFTLEGVELLINVLNDKWNLECHKKNFKCWL